MVMCHYEEDFSLGLFIFSRKDLSSFSWAVKCKCSEVVLGLEVEKWLEELKSYHLVFQ